MFKTPPAHPRAPVKVLESLPSLAASQSPVWGPGPGCRSELLGGGVGWGEARPRAKCINYQPSPSRFKSPGLRAFNHGAALPWPLSRDGPPTSHAEERQEGALGLGSLPALHGMLLIDPRNPGGCLTADSPHTPGMAPHTPPQRLGSGLPFLTRVTLQPCQVGKWVCLLLSMVDSVLLSTVTTLYELKCIALHPHTQGLRGPHIPKGLWKPNIRQRAVSENPGHVFAMLIISPPPCRQTSLQASIPLGPGVRSMLGLGVGRGDCI